LSAKQETILRKYSNEYADDYIRLNGDEIETTRGVKIHTEEAAKLYRLIAAGKDIKGYKIGYYTVISLNGVLQIGCHKINVENMHTIGKQNNLSHEHKQTDTKKNSPLG